MRRGGLARGLRAARSQRRERQDGGDRDLHRVSPTDQISVQDGRFLESCWILRGHPRMPNNRYTRTGARSLGDILDEPSPAHAAKSVADSLRNGPPDSDAGRPLTPLGDVAP